MFDYDLLKGAGKVTALCAKDFAETEFEKYRIVQDKLFESDFDRFVALETLITDNQNAPNAKKPKKDN